MDVLHGLIHCRVGASARCSMTVTLQVILRVSPAVVTGTGNGSTRTNGGGSSGGIKRS